MAISHYIFKKYNENRKINNGNLYGLIKMVITGESEISNCAEICEYLGRKEVVTRIKNAINLKKTNLNENNRLADERKKTCLKLINDSNNINSII